jgi:hypothetical protein
MSRYIRVFAAAVVLLGSVGSTTCRSAYAARPDENNDSQGCQLVQDDFRPAWVCSFAAAHHAPNQAKRETELIGAGLVPATSTFDGDRIPR